LDNSSKKEGERGGGRLIQLRVAMSRMEGEVVVGKGVRRKERRAERA